MAFKLLNNRKPKDIHEWWDYGIHPITGWRHKGMHANRDTKKYYRTPISTNK